MSHSTRFLGPSRWHAPRARPGLLRRRHRVSASAAPTSRIIGLPKRPLVDDASMLRHIKRFFDQHLAPGSVTDSADPEHVLRLAIAALLLEMTHMDGEVSPEESEAVETAILEHFELSKDEAKELLELAEEERSDATDYFQFTSLINGNYTMEQKVRLVELLWRIAYANENLHNYEEHLIRKIANLLHIPHSAFIAAKLNASGYN